MSTDKKCPTCGSQISTAAVDGLCLKCLGRLGFILESGDANDGGLRRLGDYELLEEIARGGMGVVYRARQLSLNRIVALKVVLHGPFSSADFVRRFRQEAHAVAALRHPNIVAIHEVGEQGGNHYLSLEYVEGRSFAAFAGERPLPARRAAGYLKIIAEAVEHAHRRGVLHRDLKPSNILLDAFDQPRVTDFGLAKLVNEDAALTVTGQVLGSPNYMPPEQAAGSFSDSTPQSDVYSLGAILYELLTGRPPFQGETLPTILAQVQAAEPVPPRRLNPSAPVDLQTICLKCLQKEPARRYATAQKLAEDLGRFLENKPILARPVPLPERAWLWCRRRPLLAALSAGWVAAVTLGVAGIAWQWRRAELHAQGELRQRLMAEEDAAQTRLNLYAADVAVASRAIQNGNLGLGRRTLEGLRPKRGQKDLRGFEWRYLWNLCRGDELATLRGHEGIVTCAAFSPDGERLATGSHDGTARIWNPSKGELLTTLKVTDHVVWSVGFTPDGKYLMTGCNEQVELRDTESWRVRASFPGELAALSKAGTFLATAESSPFFWEPAGAVRLWNWRTGQLLRRFDQPARALALSSDGGLLAIAGTNGSVTVWDTATGKLASQWPVKHALWSLCFSPDGRELLCAGWASEVLVLKLDGDSPPRILSGHQLHVWSAAFSQDGATIATTSSDQTVRLWDAATLEPKSILHGHNSEVWCAAFSPDGNILATGGKDENVMLWPTAAAHPKNELPHDADFRPIFSPDGKWLVTIQPGSGIAMLWNADDGSPVAQKLAGGRRIVGFSGDGKRVVSFESENLGLKYWRPNGVAPEKETALEGAAPTRARFVFSGMSPEGEFFFAISTTGLIQVWNADTGRLLRAIKGPPPPLRNAVLSPLGEQIAVCVERENVARLYDCATGVERQLAGHRDFVSGLAFSPDGSTLATGSMDGTIRLWNTATGIIIASLPGHMQETSDVAFSPDGRTLASLGQNESVKLWHLPTLREVVSENDPQAGIWLMFSPDGRKLAVETGAGKLRLLAAPTE
ncbi:MAG: serine/threonine-protein kinase [Verrucomicrobiota bacterium]|jgi:WD40 repeat protein